MDICSEWGGALIVYVAKVRAQKLVVNTMKINKNKRYYSFNAYQL